MYIPSKPGKYGIKIWVCSAVDGYICNLQIYSGKKSNTAEKGQAMRVVKDLVAPFIGSSREITADNLFSSVQLVEDLWQDRTVYTGTMRANKPQIPPEFLQGKGRESKSAIVGYNGNLMLTSYYERKGKKCANVITSKKFHIGNDSGRPAVIEYYNKTKGGVDVGDQRTRSTTVSRRSRVWSKKIFFEELDIACLNSYYIFLKIFPNWLAKKSTRRSEFLRILSEQLAVDNMYDRIAKGHLSQDLRNEIQEFIGKFDTEGICYTCGNMSGIRCVQCTHFSCERDIDIHNMVCCRSCGEKDKVQNFENTQEVSRRCQKCSKRRVFKTNIKCCFCSLFVCRNCSIEKSIILCTNCKHAIHKK